ncbi:MAG: hypothetical protein LBF27_30720 [Sphingobacterium sp.]|jgi:hypothetical protein|nr:hypothetical protein [Sphingobacterium sp.]
MRIKIKNAVDKLLALPDTAKKSIEFSHINPHLKGKSVKGKVFLADDNTIQIALTKIVGYNHKYANRSANLFLKNALFQGFGVGSILWTEEDPGTIGSVLREGTPYFGVGHAPRLDCGGWTLLDDVPVEFLRTEDGACRPGSRVTYSLFKVI